MKRITRPCVVLLATILVWSVISLVPFFAIAKKVTITLAAWEQESAVKVISEVINGILEKEHPNIQFKYLRVPSNYDAKVSTMIAGGTPPDLLFILDSKMILWAEKGAVIPLDDFLKDEKIFDVDDLFPAAKDAYTYKGNLMGVPELAFPWLLYYNKDEFDKMGLAYPDASWTWRGQFLDAAKKLTRDLNEDGKPDIFGYTQGVNYNRSSNLILADGGNYFSPDGEKCIIDQPEAYEALQFIGDMLHKYRVMPTPEERAGQHYYLFFLGGRASMYYTGYFLFERIRDGMKARWGVAPLPKGKAGRPQSYSGEAIGIVKTGKHIKEAWEVAKLFARPELAEALLRMNYSLGCLKGVAESGTGLNSALFEAHKDVLSREECQVLVDGMNDMVAMPKVDLGKIGRILAEEVWDSLVTGKKTAKEGCSEAALEINEILQKQ